MRGNSEYYFVSDSLGGEVRSAPGGYPGIAGGFDLFPTHTINVGRVFAHFLVLGRDIPYPTTAQ